MKNEKEKKRSNPIDEAVDKAKDWAKSKINKTREKIEKSKTTKTEDRRPKIPVNTLAPRNFTHDRLHKKNGGLIK